MGLLDGMKTVLGDVGAAAERAIDATGSGKLALSFAKIFPGGLPAFLDGLREAGHGAEVESWLGSGENRPVPADAVARLLGPEATERFAYDLSLRPDRVATALAEFLPAAVHAQSPDGTLAPQQNFSTQVG